MPAKHIRRINTEGGYFHILNKGISGKIVFADEQDYLTFINFLKEYLDPPLSSDTRMKTFTIRGKVYHGVPHNTKNYFGSIDLIAYSLLPDHFHLVVHQVTKGSVEKFMRSLLTRYSMYFNKKYKCTGPVFEGPYKSVVVDGSIPLLHLTRHLHRSALQMDARLADNYSSYPEYVGKRISSWVKANLLWSLLTDSGGFSIAKLGGYKNYVENYQLEANDSALLERITMEKIDEPLIRITPQLQGSTPYKVQAAPRYIEVFLSFAVFLFLFVLGYRNIISSNASKQALMANNVTPKPQNKTSQQQPVIPTTTAISTPIPLVAGVSSEEDARVVLIKVINISNSLNVRQSPTLESPIVGKVLSGEILKSIPVNSDWYEVFLPNEKSGFISSQFIEKYE